MIETEGDGEGEKKKKKRSVGSKAGPYVIQTKVEELTTK